MGFMLKSTIGLGTVYFLMFAPTAERPTLGPVASLCARAAASRAQAPETFATEAETARCLMALGVVAAPMRMTQAEDLKPAQPPRSAGQPGGLTDADLAEPWFGPGTLARKSARRG